MVAIALQNFEVFGDCVFEEHKEEAIPEKLFPRTPGVPSEVCVLLDKPLRRVYPEVGTAVQERPGLTLHMPKRTPCGKDKLSPFIRKALVRFRNDRNVASTPFEWTDTRNADGWRWTGAAGSIEPLFRSQRDVRAYNLATVPIRFQSTKIQKLIL
ncbi:hypothetical protein BT96DRAFT_933608 [Gymnopus androsaceus JB14]|uniref:Uncharacterized protein n=1 Tax=Gymnopus androsaceus JB14 TaxID=1447944 RepID=A0A6A4IBW9_9AGAR|nr:hypothetical protein BT96DRAFT_933608 [Gymnopus androsaceus JB14]